MLYDTIYDITTSFFSSKTSVNQIIPNLWLGNYHSALDTNFLLENNIDFIINCTPNMPFIQDELQKNELQKNDLEKLSNIETFRIPVNDSLLEKDIILMEQYFKIIIPLLLRKYTIEKKNILIHCYAGKQRSAIIVAALLKILLDYNYIKLTEVPNDLEKHKQFQYICNYMLLKRSQVFTYGFRINFEKTFQRFFNII